MTVSAILLMSLFFASCSEDPASSKQDGPIGTWEQATITFMTNSDTIFVTSYVDDVNMSVVLEINDDGTCVNTVSQYDNTHTDSGTWQTSDDQISFVFEEEGFEQYDYILFENKLVLTQSIQEGEDFHQGVLEYTRQ